MAWKRKSYEKPGRAVALLRRRHPVLKKAVGDWAAVWFLRKRNKSHNRTLKERRKKRKHPDEWASLVMKRNVRRFKTLNDQLAGGDVEEIERNILRNARAREANGFEDDSGSAGNSDSSSDSTEPEDENYQRFYEEEEVNSEPNTRQDKRGGDRRIQRRPIDFDDIKHAEGVANRLHKRVGDARVLGAHDRQAGIKGWPPVDWDNDNELYARPVPPQPGTQRRKQHEEGERSAPPKRLEERRVQHEGHQEATRRKSGTQFSDEELYARPVPPPTGTQRRKKHQEGERSALPKKQEERRVQHEGHQEAKLRKSGTQFSDEELYARPVPPPTGTQRRKKHEEGERSAQPKRLEDRRVQHEGHQEATLRKRGTQFSDEELYARPVPPPTGTQRRKKYEEGERSAQPKRLEDRRVQHEGRQEATPRNSGTQFSDEELYARPVRAPTGTKRRKQHEEGERSGPAKRLEERQVQHEGRQEATPRNSVTQFSDEELYARPVRAPTGTKRRKQHEEGERSALPKGLEERRVKHEGHEEDTRWKSVSQKPMATVNPKTTDQMKTTARSLGTHGQLAGIKGWPPVNWDNDEELYARPVRPPTGAQRRKQPEEGEGTALPKGLEERRVKHEGHEEDTRWKSVSQKPMATVKPKITDQMKTTVQPEARRPNVIPSSQSLPTPLKQGKSASRHFNG
jgi:hypothetical protein